ncbi:translation initiation factor IF-2, mitochondrial-like isoform X1 [Amphibalanus amphitrite]|uniref:translation initiation factor IF-2, mitochondrial-like isoform X1 n=1 Tax=Amphibalanus amphitrite TaxID=1232801 RepID=UPI001C91B177|nr:translation initiation factor IF-2, mitochondrial-like isoform X1 [Amphibalanus amphitrite]XP_043214906.1 translation initiation factor IF-2, mitochondrial-like isoform X1 [Amphibalanus amphitrite]XP_043214907.1 translation initiation factor IF-2, mitochondrial-like isoform X1 [Amphibalanus amphitrite]XP_043214908.1 translation initiation factor IF-2, mitochondrial-like isoform X1 [Amphibalanus amphitrite]XP_043214909.1 translation initiation factor IF-2, mitochondrial-like isoform X1 [Amphi
MAALLISRIVYSITNASGSSAARGWLRAGAGRRWQRPPDPSGALPGHACSLCGQTRALHMSARLLKQRKTKETKKLAFKPKAKSDPVVKIWRNMTVAELAAALEKTEDHVYEAMLFIPGTDDYDSSHAPIGDISVLQGVVKKTGRRAAVVAAPEPAAPPVSKDIARRPPPADWSAVPRRPPVVTIMGHVDHGKTTLLDALRHSHVVDSEFGGITQHIGAFRVQLDDETMTFLDTPGHAAFSAMRHRGALATDLVVLVVAADDGVMEQTRESVRHAEDAGVPLLVAINKCDKPEADVEATKRSLLEAGVQLEELGGEVQAVQISALRGHGLTELKETILTLAELLDLRAERTGPVEGVVLESRTDPKRGRLSTVLVQRGTLRRGAVLVAGGCWARVRAMFDDAGRPVQRAPPSAPVEVLGWKELPSAGLEVLEVDSEKHAKEVVTWRHHQESFRKAQEDQEAAQQRLEKHLSEYRAEREERLKRGLRYRPASSRGPRQKEITDEHTGPTLSVIVKGDVDGSVEAILDVLDTYHESDVRLDLVHYGVGNVTESDVSIAKMFNAVVYGFNVEAPPDVAARARSDNTPIRLVNVIYRLVDDVRQELNKLMPLKEVDEVIGEANVLQEFVVTEKKHKIPVAGCRCTKGQLKKADKYRLVREGETVYDGTLSSMRHLKNEVDTVKKDVECGLMLADPEVRFQPGDVLVCYRTVRREQTTDWDPGF